MFLNKTHRSKIIFNSIGSSISLTESNLPKQARPFSDRGMPYCNLPARSNHQLGSVTPRVHVARSLLLRLKLLVLLHRPPPSNQA
jgi:hypothetical protein